FLGLMGPSGSGKTTLLNLIAGIDRPDAGSVAVAGTDVTKLSESEAARWRATHIGFVFQFYNLLPVLTAFENVELPLLLAPLSKAERKKHVETALTLVGLADRMRHYPRHLAGVTGAAANRMITRHRVSLIFPIPLPYRDEIARVPGVTAVSWANWFGGVYGEANDFKNFWPRFAVDPDTYFDLYPEFQLSPDQ